VSTLPNDCVHSRKGFSAVAVTCSLLTVYVESTIPEGSADEDDDELGSTENDDDDEPATAGKLSR